MEGPPHTGAKPPLTPRHPARLSGFLRFGIGQTVRLSTLRCRLGNDPELCVVCGFAGRMLSYPTFRRIVDQLASMAKRINEYCQILPEQLRELLPGLGTYPLAETRDASLLCRWRDESGCFERFYGLFYFSGIRLQRRRRWRSERGSAGDGFTLGVGKQSRPLRQRRTLKRNARNRDSNPFRRQPVIVCNR